MKVETSNLACRLITNTTIEQVQNQVEGGHEGGSGDRTYFWNFGTPSIYRELLKLETWQAD